MSKRIFGSHNSLSHQTTPESHRLAGRHQQKGVDSDNLYNVLRLGYTGVIAN